MILNILNCKKIRDDMLEKAKVNVQGKKMKLVVIQVVGDMASDIYIKNKKKVCEQIGIEFEHITMQSDVEYETLAKMIKACNEDNFVTGLMLQLPLPQHLQQYEQRLINLIDWKKDVDGLTTENIGRLWSGQQCITPCTAQGIIDLIPFELEGKSVGIFGRSNLIGKPLVKLFTDKNATVTLCHTKTNPETRSRAMTSDIVVLATGNPRWCNMNMVRKDSIIIDAGISRDKHGKLCGDFDDYDFYYSGITYTKVPNGVGLITVAQLMLNVIKAYELQRKII